MSIAWSSEVGDVPATATPVTLLVPFGCILPPWNGGASPIPAISGAGLLTLLVGLLGLGGFYARRRR